MRTTEASDRGRTLLAKPANPACSEIQMQSELYRSAAKSSPADLSEIRDRRIRVGLRELRVIRQVEEISRKGEARLFPGGDFEILLQGEIKIVDAWIPDIREVARRVPKGLGDIEWTRQVHQPGRWAGPREVECTRIKPVIGGLVEARRKRIADHHGTIRQHACAIAESIRIVRNPKWRTTADRVDGARPPSAEHLAPNATVEPFLSRPKRQFHNRGEREARRYIAGADRAVCPAVVKVLPQYVE